MEKRSFMDQIAGHISVQATYSRARQPNRLRNPPLLFVNDIRNRQFLPRSHVRRWEVLVWSPVSLLHCVRHNKSYVLLWTGEQLSLASLHVRHRSQTCQGRSVYLCRRETALPNTVHVRFAVPNTVQQAFTGCGGGCTVECVTAGIHGIRSSLFTLHIWI